MHPQHPRPASTTRTQIKRAARILYGEALVAGFFGAATIASDYVPAHLTAMTIPSPIPAPPAHPVADVGSSWPLVWGVIGVGVLGAFVIWAVERLAKAGAEVDRLADPDVPHECDREVGF